MNRFKIVFFLMLFIITIPIITIIPILVNEEIITMAQDQEQGVTPIDPEKVTNQSLQGYPTEDKNMSTGIQNK